MTPNEIKNALEELELSKNSTPTDYVNLFLGLVELASYFYSTEDSDV